MPHPGGLAYCFVPLLRYSLYSQGMQLKFYEVRLSVSLTCQPLHCCTVPLCFCLKPTVAAYSSFTSRVVAFSSAVKLHAEGSKASACISQSSELMFLACRSWHNGAVLSQWKARGCPSLWEVLQSGRLRQQASELRELSSSWQLLSPSVML